MTGFWGRLRRGVERDDAAAERFGDRVFKSRFEQQRAHGFATRELLDGFAEVVVGGFFSGEQRGDPRQRVVQVGAVNPAERRRGNGKIEDEDVAAGIQDAVHFGEGGGVRLHVAQAEGDGERVESGVGKGQAETVGGDELGKTLALGDAEHGVAEIRTNEQCAGTGGTDGQCEVAAAGRKIENVRGLPAFHDLRGAFSPKKIEAAAEEMIREVVASCDGGKHGAHAGALAVEGDRHGGVEAVLRTAKAYHMLFQSRITAANFPARGRRRRCDPHMHQPLLNKARVLIVDDEPSNIRLLECVLEKYGSATVRSTTDSRQVLPLYFEFHPDLVLLDLHMPHLDGFAVIEQLKAAVPPDDYLPILVLTADVTVDTKRRALKAGAKDLVTKPLDNFEVVLRMNNLLENRFLHLELQKQNQGLEEQVRERTARLEELLEELRSAQEQVVKQERLSALGMMAGGIAHDFNNALTMVLGYGELLVPYMLQSAPEREIAYLRHMIAAAQDATHVVSRLREFYRPATCNDVRVPVDLNEVVQQAVSLTAPKWKGKARMDGVQIEVLTNLQATTSVAGNAAELREVLTNLVFNAVDAMPRGGKIVVSTGMRGSYATIAVSDSGTGMSEEDRARCLEPFFTTKGERGTGLGLSVVYGIIQRHGGTIEIRSEIGRGTTFDISLPLATFETMACEAPKEAGVSRALRILVADDQEVICELIAEYLRADGHTVDIACDGNDALQKFDPARIDMVVTDQSMPGMSGEQLAKKIHAMAPGTPVILLTGFGDEMQARGTLPEGICLIVGKPVSAADLRRAVLVASGAEDAQAAAAA